MWYESPLLRGHLRVAKHWSLGSNGREMASTRPASLVVVCTGMSFTVAQLDILLDASIEFVRLAWVDSNATSWLINEVPRIGTAPSRQIECLDSNRSHCLDLNSIQFS
jgi:hypothetical protein